MINRWYRIDKDKRFLIVALPEMNQHYTLLDFEYQLEGEEYSDFHKWYFETFTNNEENEDYFVILIIAGCIIILSCLICCFVLIYRVFCFGPSPQER